jgi:hypothetical protein
MFLTTIFDLLEVYRLTFELGSNCSTRLHWIGASSSNEVRRTYEIPNSKHQILTFQVSAMIDLITETLVIAIWNFYSSSSPER